MIKDRLPADNPTSAIFDLADQMSNNFNKIRYLKYYAYVFVGITLIFLIILSLYFLAIGYIAVFIILLALIISGFMLLRLIIFTKNFLEDFDKNFRAIKQVREIDPLPKIPHGRTPLERLEAYLKNHDPAIARELRLGVEMTKDFKVGNTTWDLAVHRKTRTLGPEGHLTLIRYEKGKLKMKQFIKLEKDLESFVAGNLLPERVIILHNAPDNYDGISDDLYSYLTEKSHYILKNGRKYLVKLQLFVESAGRYEIIPLIP
ncbi:hypothetical protein [[Eubacterium] cellulosolvens]